MIVVILFSIILFIKQKHKNIDKKCNNHNNYFTIIVLNNIKQH